MTAQPRPLPYHTADAMLHELEIIAVFEGYAVALMQAKDLARRCLKAIRDERGPEAEREFLERVIAEIGKPKVLS